LKERAATDAVAALAPAVEKLLGEGVPEPVQLAALEAVQSLELRGTAPVLVATVSNPKASEALRIGALRTLDALGGNEVLDAVSAAEKSDVQALRLAALQIVAKRSPERAIPVIKRFAASKSAVEQQAAFQSMGQQSPQRRRCWWRDRRLLPANCPRHRSDC
jgi:hypothetical protein